MALSQEEVVLASLMERTGMLRASARCLVALMRGGSWRSGELAASTGLPQPVVSVGMRALMEGGLAECQTERPGGRGRPAHLYRLVVEANEAVRRVESARRVELEAELAALDALRGHAQS